jgi:aspartate/methionine/tyrosine aminotransferase
MQSPETLGALIADCEAHGRWFISDEIYHGITFNQRAVSAAGKGDHVIVVNSFSKYYCMTGWRLGWLAVPPRVTRTIERLAQNLFISAPSLSQIAAMAAFDAQPELDRRVAGYARNRNILLEGLPEVGITHIAPADGAFYLYADVSNLTDDAIGFCKRMLHEAKVAATPGLDFDPVRGHKFVRFSYAGAEADMAEAVRRLKAWL